ncbi:hypothetical protein AVEN_75898-1 [Araneus ventricosus]|uniref:Uncharacterized protein n=1 Tax=Araneus ventricosus TaxID=182803 RepID=A0A4Y2FRD3_ARAVE|nr:hypothetical protein AVEN_75898-1 [Araneus ventricosus]
MHEFWTCRETEWSILKFTKPPLNVADLPSNFFLYSLDLPLNFALNFLDFYFHTLDFLFYFSNTSVNMNLNFFNLTLGVCLDLAFHFLLSISQLFFQSLLSRSHLFLSNFHFLFQSGLCNPHLFLSSLHLCHHGKQLFKLFIHRSGQRSGLRHSQENQNNPTSDTKCN